MDLHQKSQSRHSHTTQQPVSICEQAVVRQSCRQVEAQEAVQVHLIKLSRLLNGGSYVKHRMHGGRCAHNLENLLACPNA